MDEHIVGYWPFDNGLLIDKSENHNVGKLVLPSINMAYSPDGRLFYAVRDIGEIRIINKNSTFLGQPFVRLEDPATNESQELLGITLDPDYPANHFVYAFVRLKDSTTGNVLSRVIRFTESNDKAADQKILLDNIPAANGRRFAGALAFGPDDKLYVAVSNTSKIEKGQNGNLSGKVLRIERDGTIPQDNPFSNSAITQGHGNMFGIAFDRTTGTGIVAENNPSRNNEINVLRKGENYGSMTGDQQEQSPKSGVLKNGSILAIKPARTYQKVMAPSQMLFYDDNKFPSLKAKFLVVSYAEPVLRGLAFNNTGNLIEEVSVRLPEVRGHIASIAKAPGGDIYIGGENIYKLVSIDKIKPTYYIEANSKNIQIKDLSVNLTSKIISIDIVNNKNNASSQVNVTATPILSIKVPKNLLGTIYYVISEKYNDTANSVDKIVNNFKTKETLRVSNVGDTIIEIQLKNIDGSDKIFIKGKSSSLIPPPKDRVIYR